MRITYIKHSGFLAEWEDVACIFDWAEGDLPPVSREKKLYIFVSHAHRDHFVPELYERCAYHPQRTYILSEVSTSCRGPAKRARPSKVTFF